MDYEQLAEKLMLAAEEKKRLQERLALLEDAEKKFREAMAALDNAFGVDVTDPKPSPTNDILDAAEFALIGQDNPMSSGEIYEQLTADGIRIGGSNPVSNLAAKLSQAKERFRSHGRGKGWSLASAVPVVVADPDDDIPF